MGNKGGIFIKFSIKNEFSIGFTNLHLAAGQNKYSKRGS